MGITIREIVEEIGGGIAGRPALQGRAGRRALRRLHPGAPGRHAASTTRSWRRRAPSWARAGWSSWTTATAWSRSPATSCSSRRTSPAASARSAASARKRMLEILERICDGQGTDGRPARRSTSSASRRQGGQPVRTRPDRAQPGADDAAVLPRRVRGAHPRAALPGRPSCKALIHYRVLDTCTGCTLCAQACPAGAIEARPYQRHEVADDCCTRCGMCVTACPEHAIEVA